MNIMNFYGYGKSVAEILLRKMDSSSSTKYSMLLGLLEKLTHSLSESK